MKRGKKYRECLGKYDPANVYGLQEGVELIKSLA